MDSQTKQLSNEDTSFHNDVCIPDKHIDGWTEQEHYNSLGYFCGQNCPCCRAEYRETLGSCLICLKNYNIIDNEPKIKQLPNNDDTTFHTDNKSFHTDDTSFHIDKHIDGWTEQEHYNSLGYFCGQNCPCCRAQFKETLGSCLICLKNYNIIDNQTDYKK